ncbi:MAG: helix-turn-helix transcriptional regulator [Lachnospiraceae bacterium]|nr:helix-turn-helix transcriptional regulator [Lachnospiraceae bacterium]
MGMTQLEFAKHMGVSQGMVSKWESREYNFTNTN